MTAASFGKTIQAIKCSLLGGRQIRVAVDVFGGFLSIGAVNQTLNVKILSQTDQLHCGFFNKTIQFRKLFFRGYDLSVGSAKLHWMVQNDPADATALHVLNGFI